MILSNILVQRVAKRSVTLLIPVLVSGVCAFSSGTLAGEPYQDKVPSFLLRMSWRGAPIRFHCEDHDYLGLQETLTITIGASVADGKWMLSDAQSDHEWHAYEVAASVRGPKTLERRRVSRSIARLSSAATMGFADIVARVVGNIEAIDRCPTARGYTDVGSGTAVDQLREGGLKLSPLVSSSLPFMGPRPSLKSVPSRLLVM